MPMPVRAAAIATGASLLIAANAFAQDTAARRTQDSTLKGGKPITAADIKAWNGIRSTALSNDGKWFAWVVSPSEGDATLYYRSTARDAKEVRVPVGNGGGSVAISGDSKWLGYLINPPRPASGGRRGAAPGGGRGGTDSTSRNADASRFVLVQLATGEKHEFERIRRFSFNADTATWVVMQAGTATPGGGGPAVAVAAGTGATAGPGAAAASSDLLLYNLATGETFNAGRVREYAFDRTGNWLAYTMDAPDQIGNGVQLRNMRSGAARSLESARLLYSNLAWADSSRALSVMRGKIDSTGRDTTYSIEAFTTMGADGPTGTLLFDPAGRADFPKGWKIAADRAPRYSEGMASVFFSIRENPKSSRRAATLPGGGAPGQGGTGAVPPGGGRGGAASAPSNGNASDSLPSLILWHWKDTRLQSQQIVQEQTDRATSYLAEYRVADNKFVQLADTALRTVTVTPGDRFAYGVDTRGYDERASYTGRNYQDVYRVDLETGKRTLLQRKKLSGAMTPSPDGKRVLFWGKDANWWVMDLATGDSVNITRGVPTSFVNTDEDHNNLFPPAAGSRGWSNDGAWVLLYDGWDVWKVATRPGPAAVNLTGDGRAKQLRYQTLYSFASSGRGGRGAGAASAQGIDLSQPLWFGTYGEWTKKEGLARVEPGKAGAKELAVEDAKLGVIKARDADTFLYTRQTFTDYPNWWVFNNDFRSGYQISDVNPQQKNFAWSSGTRLIDYTSAKGDRLQGALYLPANYQPGKKYPMIVTIYEKRSQGRNIFITPSDTRAPDPSLYTSRGYAVFDPDIVYKINDPGMSAVWAVIPAVKAVIATGIVDPKRVGLWGHSWGGYQTAFLVTQTDIFAAAIAGAPLTNMVSMYASVYWNSGGSDAAIFESSQGRFKGNFIENQEAYIRNSPVFHADKVHTPLMILANDKDGAVDFNQGITYYNTLRQLGKEVVFLEYVGENHGLARPVNQRDYAVRMAEFFDHYLKDATAPDWLKNGVPRLQMEEHLTARRDSTVKDVNGQTMQP